MEKKENQRMPSSSGLFSAYWTIVPLLLAVSVPLYSTSLFENKLSFLAKLHQIVPSECSETSPPSSECINQVLPWIIGSLIAIVVLYVGAVLTAPPSQNVLDVIEQEFEKRHEVLRGLLDELESNFVHSDDGDLEIFNAKVVWERLLPLTELVGFDRVLAARGFEWLWIVLEKDLVVTYRLTMSGEDVKFASGIVLRKLVDDLHAKLVKARTFGFAPTGETQRRLYKLQRQSVRYLRLHNYKTMLKAFQMALHAKAAFPWLLLQTLGTGFSSTLRPLNLFYRAQVLENLASDSNTFWLACQAMMLMELLGTVCNLLTSLIKLHANTLARREIQLAYYEALLKMPLSFWSRQSDMGWREQISFYSVYYEFAREVTEFLEMPQKVLQQVVTAATYAYIIFYTSSSKSLLLLVGANFGSKIVLFFLSRLNKWLTTLSQNGVIKESSEDFICLVYSLDPEYISTFLSFVRGTTETKRFAKLLTSEAEAEKRSKIVEVINEPLSSVVSQSSQVFQFSTVRSIGAGIADADTMVRSGEEFVTNVNGLSRIISRFIDNAAPLAKAYDVLSLRRTIDLDRGLWPKTRAKGLIEFRNVRFRYPRRDVEVLKGVTFTVHAGETVGMTGSAGCGKSTCMRLLERFYDVTDGEIYLDGVDIREYNPQWLRSQISTVAQEPRLVPLTIRDNVTFGCAKEPSMEEILSALKAANIYEAIMDKTKFPQGLRTKMDSTGNVSGGEKQRIAIARAILADPPILLLDEATSALDEDNQEKVQQALERLMKGRTTLIIAHRLSTIKNSSKIVAFEDGKVTEEGSHDELLRESGSLYRKLWIQQTTKRVGIGHEAESEETVKAELLTECT